MNKPMLPDHLSENGWLKWSGLLLGPLLAVVVVACLPTQYADAAGVTRPFDWAGRATLGVMVWMGIWWLTEAVEISVTALLPIVMFPLLGATTAHEACFPYADPLIFLYFGGFILALSMERWGLGRRIALLTLRTMGTSARAMVAGFMLVTAVLSAFVSNTATTAMMLPIALSVIGLLQRQCDEQPDLKPAVSRFATCLLLAVAYSASVGGVMTIIGTPTNTFLVGFLKDSIAPEYRIEFSFAGWLPIGVSFAAIFLPTMYWILTRMLFPIQGIELTGGRSMVDRELRSLGKMSVGEWNTLVVFVTTVSLWLFRPLLVRWHFEWSGESYQPLAHLSDTIVAMGAAMLLFLTPVCRKPLRFTMDWHTASKMPWGILFLFGGGLSLAAAVQAGGVAEFIGSQAVGLAMLPPLVLVLLATTTVVFLTELTSNAATTASLVPVLAALGPGIGVHPYLLVIPATVAASCAFMLPVATPPNAIVFGSGRITTSQMVRAGFSLNLVAIGLVMLLTWCVIKPWLGI
ncbi:MAG: DASS family sodium-coupled anion symporter [Planctomycetales bacterium]|nr:DASS family sodium-coupled anion symporter [Planctomycetales bacterium]